MLLEHRKKRRKGTAACFEMPSPPIKTYNVGVYFPDRDLLKFVVTCHDFSINPEDNTASFFNMSDVGSKEFVGIFTHVAYILLGDTDSSEKEEICVPKGFGNIFH